MFALIFYKKNFIPNNIPDFFLVRPSVNRISAACVVLFGY